VEGEGEKEAGDVASPVDWVRCERTAERSVMF
jgi:hypothetical protein